MPIDTEELQTALTESMYLPEELPVYPTTDVDDLPDEAIVVEGVINTFVFHPERLEEQRQKVREWLLQLPHPFRETEGGGWSFLSACMTQAGEHWGEHRNIDMLFVLGTGLGYVRCLIPREMWPAMPGGMPYYIITKKAIEEADLASV